MSNAINMDVSGPASGHDRQGPFSTRTPTSGASGSSKRHDTRRGLRAPAAPLRREVTDLTRHYRVSRRYRRHVHGYRLPGLRDRRLRGCEGPVHAGTTRPSRCCRGIEAAISAGSGDRLLRARHDGGTERAAHPARRQGRAAHHRELSATSTPSRATTAGEIFSIRWNKPEPLAPLEHTFTARERHRRDRRDRDPAGGRRPSTPSSTP